MKTTIFAALALCAVASAANAACPTNGSVTVPFPSGTADVVVYSSPACVTLSGTDLKVQLNNAGGPILSSTSVPAMTADAAGLHLSANGAPFGAAYTLLIWHTPSGKAVTITANIGQATVAITASTPTP